MLISHSVDPMSLTSKVEEISTRLIKAGDSPYATVAEKLEMLKQLSEFELGRYLIVHGGFNGRWSHYAFYEFPRLLANGAPLHPLEVKWMTSARTSSHRERLKISQQCLSHDLFEGISILSVPCGVMAELSTLNMKGIEDFRFVGVDLDQESIDLAKEFAAQQGVEKHVSFFERNAWKLGMENEFDRVVSLGLAYYSADLQTALDLYRSFYKALKKGGKLLVTYMTPPLELTDSERDPSKTTPEDLRRGKILTEILQFKSESHFSTSAQIEQRLKDVGFHSVKCHFSAYRLSNIAEATK